MGFDRVWFNQNVLKFLMGIGFDPHTDRVVIHFSEGWLEWV